MVLRNETELVAGWLNTSMSEDVQMGSVIARSAYSIQGGSLIPTSDISWPVQGAGGPSDFGDMPPDTPFLPGGFDVMVVGECVAPGEEPVDALAVSIRVGNAFEQRIDVFGDRVWTRGPGDSLVPSRPQPFHRMPLSYEKAFGGSTTVELGSTEWPHNPDGVGFHGSWEAALGGPLPNLEHPDDRIRSWDQQVVPWCWAPYPEKGLLRRLRAADVDENDPIGITGLNPTLFNQAHPDMVIPPAQAPTGGDIVEVHSMSDLGPVRFPIPTAEFHLHTQLEERNYLFPMVLDQMVLNPTEGTVAFSYRGSFRYRVRPLEKRVTTLYAGPLPETVPSHYPLSWDHGGRPVAREPGLNGTPREARQ